MWRLVYSKFEGRLKEIVAMRIIRSYEPVEKIYYSVGTYEQICVYCCSNKSLAIKEQC